MRIPWSFIGTILRPVIAMFSPAIKMALDDSIRRLYVRARETSNPLDDLGVEILAGLVGVDLSAAKAEAERADGVSQ